MFWMKVSGRKPCVVSRFQRNLIMAINKYFVRWIIGVSVTILSFITTFLHCTLPQDPALNPENVSFCVIETDTSKEIVIGDSLKIKIAVFLPYLVDSVQIRVMDSVYLTFQNISDTVTVSVLPTFPGKFTYTVKGYCQRSVVKESSGHCTVKNVHIVVSSEPQSISTVEDSSVEFMILATGKPAPTIQWFRDSIPITGATNDTLKIISPTAAMSGYTFRARLTNSVDTIWSKTVVLTVTPNVFIWDVMLWDDVLWL